MTDMIKQGAQILNAEEYNELRAAMNPTHQHIFDGMIFTGMRIEEFWIFCENPLWFKPDRNYISLKKEAIRKPKTRYKERDVLLSHVGTRAIRDLVAAIRRGEIERITRMGWSENLKRAARKAGLKYQEGIMPKMCRKTWVSWLMVSYPEDGLRIAASLGHDIRTMQEHYLNLPFSEIEKAAIKPLVIGWGGRN
jgi:integrase